MPYLILTLSYLYKNLNYKFSVFQGVSRLFSVGYHVFLFKNKVFCVVAFDKQLRNFHKRRI